jgi:hypothetical protein
VRAIAGAAYAAIRIGEREVLRTEDGVLLVLMSAGGEIHTTAVLTGKEDFRVRPAPGPFSVYDVGRRTMPVALANNVWSRLDGSSGLIVLTIPPGGTATLLGPHHAGCQLRVVDRSAGELVVAADAIGESLVPPGLVPGPRPTGSGYQAVRLSVPPIGPRAGVLVASGCVGPMAVLATVPGATAFPVQPRGLLDMPQRSAETILMARTRQSWLLGSGWSAVEVDAAGPFRWLEGPAAALVLPVTREGATRVRLQVLSHQVAGSGSVRLQLGPASLSSRPLVPGWDWYEWTLPAPLAPGIHQLTISWDGEETQAGGPGQRAMAVSQVELLGGGQ